MFVCKMMIQTARVSVVYTAVPVFKQLSDRPHDRNVTVGENVVFHCNAYAIPDASVEWFKNGEKINRMSFWI